MKGPSVKNAAVSKRIAAFLTDFIIIVVLCFSLLYVGIGSEAPKDFQTALTVEPTSEQLITTFYFMLFLYLYHFFCEYVVGRTLGMQLWGIYVTNTEKTKEELPKFGQTFLRNLFIFPFLLGFFLSIVWMAELFYYIFAGKRLFEHLSKTDVVETIR